MEEHKVAITSISLGRSSAGHKLATRLKAAQQYGFDGIEMAFEDVSAVTEALNEGIENGRVPVTQIAAARRIRDFCTHRGLKIICLQPFSQYEGLVDREQHTLLLLKLKNWIKLAHALSTDLILIPSNFLPADRVSDDFDLMVTDLRELADIGAAADPPIRFAYEALCWGTRVNTWEESWDIVKSVDRENFGICLDTFNIAGRVFADPTAPDGKQPNAEQAIDESMSRLIVEVDVNKIFYVQVIDAEKLTAPLVQGHRFYDAQQPARMSWSRNCRLFYGETDGSYLPIDDIANVIFNNMGYTGWVSLELFNLKMEDRGEDVPTDLAHRGAKSWYKLVRDMNLCVGSAVREDI